MAGRRTMLARCSFIAQLACQPPDEERRCPEEPQHRIRALLHTSDRSRPRGEHPARGICGADSQMPRRPVLGEEAMPYPRLRRPCGPQREADPAPARGQEARLRRRGGDAWTDRGWRGKSARRGSTGNRSSGIVRPEASKAGMGQRDADHGQKAEETAAGRRRARRQHRPIAPARKSPSWGAERPTTCSAARTRPRISGAHVISTR